MKKTSRNLSVKAFLVLLIGLSIGVSPLCAQDSPSPVLQAGLSVEQIRKLYGEPDRVQDGHKVQSWYYGKSFIMFSDSVTTAWSDEGELTRRVKEKHFQQEAPPIEPEYFIEKGWDKPWRPTDEPTAAEVLDSLLGGDEPTD